MEKAIRVTEEAIRAYRDKLCDTSVNVKGK